MNTSIQIVEQIDWRSSPKARMTEPTLSDELQLEKKKKFASCFTREMCQIECGHPGKFLVDVMQRVFRTKTTTCCGRPY